ncbi:MAG: hypothetical protein ACE5JB_16440 [bacterium]
MKLLEPYDGKLSRTVLRGDWGGNTPVLPGHLGKFIFTIFFIKNETNNIFN